MRVWVEWGSWKQGVRKGSRRDRGGFIIKIYFSGKNELQCNTERMGIAPNV